MVKHPWIVVMVLVALVAGCRGEPARDPTTIELSPTATVRAGLPAPDQPSAVIRDAVSLLLSRYHTGLEAGRLYADAWEGAIRVLMAAGVESLPVTPTFPREFDRATTVHLRVFPALDELAATTIGPPALTAGALRLMIERRRDCRTRWLSPDEARTETRPPLPSAAHELGLRLAGPPLWVTDVFPGSAAYQAGMRRGTLIQRINDRPATTLAPVEADGRLARGIAEVNVFQIANPGDARSQIVTVTTMPRPIAGFDLLPPGIGLIRIDEFPVDDRLMPALRATLLALDAAGARGWIVDLRGVGGDGRPIGPLSQFMPAGRLYADSRHDQPPAYYLADGSAAVTQRPMVVLVDGGTTGAAEIFAASVQASYRAKLVGDKTAGCMGEYRTFELADGSLLAITVSVPVFAGDERRLPGVPLNADIRIPAAAGRGFADDPQLNAALAALRAELGTQ